MPPEMMTCPRCGVENSVKKRVCHHCRASLVHDAARQGTLSAGTNLRRSLPVRSPSTPGPASNLPDRDALAISDYIVGVSLRQRAQFYRQMYSLLNAGIPVGLALTHTLDNITLAMRGRVHRLAEHVMAGGRLSEGMNRYPALFPDWEVSVVVAAEKAGTLPPVMRDIADTLEMEWDLRARTQAATFHLKLTGLVAVIVLLLLYSLGLFGGGFLTSETGVDIVAILERVALQVLILVVLGFGIVYGLRIYSRTRNGGRIMMGITSSVPILGTLWKGIARIRFVRVLSALWHAGVSPLESLDIAARTTGNYHLMYQIADNAQQLNKGATISSILAGTRFLPAQALYLIQTGETTGDVAEALSKIADYYTVEVDAQAKTLPVKIQLLMYAILVPLVGWLMITFYVRYFSALVSF